MYRELGSFERLLIAILVTFTFGALFAPSAIAQSDAYAAKTKIANDYNAGKFKEVIADGELLRKNNVRNTQYQLIIGQAYYKAGDFTGCVKYIHETFGASPNDTALMLLNRCSELSR
jgi:hypothetical protein